MFNTVNAILLKKGDALLVDNIRDKRVSGWTIPKIAHYYNIWESETHARPEMDPARYIPKELYGV